MRWLEACRWTFCSGQAPTPAQAQLYLSHVLSRDCTCGVSYDRKRKVSWIADIVDLSQGISREICDIIVLISLDVFGRLVVLREHAAPSNDLSYLVSCYRSDGLKSSKM